DRRNIATHFAGVPMIVFAVVLALATVSLPLGGVAVTLAAITCIACGLYWLILDRVVGATLAVVLFLMCAGASEVVARTGAGSALAWAAGIFAAGWALQFLGHKYEGM